MTIRRTTLAAERDDLAVLEGEARRRGVSLAQVLRDVVAQEAKQIRARIDKGEKFEDLAKQSLCGVEHAVVIQRPAAAQALGRNDHPVSRVFKHIDCCFRHRRSEVVVECVGP